MEKLPIFEYHDITRVKKLMSLTNIDTFWDDVRKLTRRVTSDHAIHHWQYLAELRFKMLTGEED